MVNVVIPVHLEKWEMMVNREALEKQEKVVIKVTRDLREIAEKLEKKEHQEKME